MKLLMISGDRSILQGKKGAFWYTLEEFRKHWERVDVIVPSPPSPGPFPPAGEKGNPLNNPFENVFFHPSPWGLVNQVAWITEKGKQLIAEHHHDVMTAQEYPPFYNGIGACRLHKATGVPYVLEVHHIVGWPCAASLSEWLGRLSSYWQLPKSAYYAAAVRTVNRAVQEKLIWWGVLPEKVHVVPSFYLDTDALKPASSIKKDVDLVFCARLVANKGLFEVLKAVQSVPEVTLLVIGDGPERVRHEAQVKRLGIGNRVTFAGWLPDQAAVTREMQRGKIFIMNSKSEGGPRVALEAMALGLPVIATRVGVMPDVIEPGKNGVFTDGSPGHLAESITALLQDGERREKIGQEAKKITEKFERKKLIKEYADFVKKSAK